MKTLDFNKILYIFIYMCVGVLVLFRGAIYYPDSYAFLEMEFNRSPVYNIFLKIFTSVFYDNFEYPLIITQYSFAVVAINYFLRTLKESFIISFYWLIVIQIVMLAPYIYFHYVANNILSEAISYPIFLLLFSLNLKTFIEVKLKYIYSISIVLFFLIFTRSQFMALYPVVIAVVLYVGYINKSIFPNWHLITLLLLIPILTIFSEKTYNKVTYGYFVNSTLGNVVAISSPFYIANEGDQIVLNTAKEKAYFKIVYESLKEAKLTRADAVFSEDNYQDDYMYYHKNFVHICNVRIHELGLRFFKNEGLNYYEQNIALNKLCSKMIIPLIKRNFKIWTKLFIKNLNHAFGSFRQLFLFFILLVYSLFSFKKTNNNIYKLIVLSIMFMFANNAFIALVIHSIERYVFYFDWVIFVIVILLLNEILKPKHSNEY